jgi:hypothetical protein
MFMLRSNLVVFTIWHEALNNSIDQIYGRSGLVVFTLRSSLVVFTICRISSWERPCYSKVISFYIWQNMVKFHIWVFADPNVDTNGGDRTTWPRTQFSRFFQSLETSARNFSRTPIALLASPNWEGHGSALPQHPPHDDPSVWHPPTVSQAAQ